MKKEKKIKKWKIEKKNKLIKAMIFVIASFCTTCTFILNFYCGLALLGFVALLYYIVTRPVEAPNLSDLLKAVQNDTENT